MDHHRQDRHEHHETHLSFAEKARKLIDHWIRHNREHAQSYHQWAANFRDHHLGEAAALLAAAAEMTARINLSLEQAAGHIPVRDERVAPGAEGQPEGM